MSSYAVTTLNSHIEANRNFLQLAARNITLREVEGYTKKTAYLESNSGTTPTTVNMGRPQRAINKVLADQVQATNSSLNRQQTIDNYMSDIELLWGQKGNTATFSENLSEFINALNAVSSNSSDINKTQVVNRLSTLAQNINNIAETITTLRTKADSEISIILESCNADLEKFAELNGLIASIEYIEGDNTNLLDQRDVIMHRITKELHVPNVTANKYNELTLSTKSGAPLVAEGQPFKFTYRPVPIAVPGLALSDIYLHGINITNDIQDGRLKGLLEVRDTILPGLQEQMDEFTRQLRDIVNSIHNQGTSTTPLQTLIGEVSLPGSGGSTTTSSTVFSGSGTLRLAAIGARGEIGGYTDIALSDNMTVGGLISQINAATFSGQTGSPIAVTASLSAYGELTLTTASGYGVSLGSNSSTLPQASLGAAFDASTALGFSHFFGTGNLLKTGRFLASTTPQVGISNTLSINSAILNDSTFFSTSKLTATTIPTYGVEGGVAFGNTTTARELATALQRTNHTFATAGSIPVKTTTLLDYSSLLIETAQKSTNDSHIELKRQADNYNNFSNLASDYSSVDPTEVLTEIMNLVSSQGISSKALNMILSSIRDVASTLTKI